MSKHVSPFSDVPLLDHTFLKERVAIDVFLCCLAGCEDCHRSEWLTWVVEKGSRHQEPAFLVQFFRASYVSRNVIWGVYHSLLEVLVAEDNVHHIEHGLFA